MQERNRTKVYNFGAGPAALPMEVLEQARDDMLSVGGTGLSVLEISHRSNAYAEIQASAETALRALLKIPEGYSVLFLQGGASQQFAMVPMNFLPERGQAGYVLTGSWAEKALEEASGFGAARVAASTKAAGYQRIPEDSELAIDAGDAYLHITTNNTIVGSQWQKTPRLASRVPLVADMSSDICSKPVDVGSYGLIYAGAQKNLGPAGVTVVIVRDDWLRQASVDRHIPTILRYATHVQSQSTYNTPPVFCVYMVNLVTQWLLRIGGLAEMERRNRKKAQLIYSGIDASDGFYRAVVDAGSRSLMNATFRLKTPELETEFLETAKQAGFVGLSGHRSVGGVRVSLYNAVPLEWCERLRELMDDFRRTRR